MKHFKFGTRSLKNLATVKPNLQCLSHRALEISKVDFTVICGKRTQDEQDLLVKMGRSWTHNSKHLTGDAIDFVPCPVDFNDYSKFQEIADAFFQAADELGMQIRWGGDWNRNGSYKDEIKRGSYDGGHVELVV